MAVPSDRASFKAYCLRRVSSLTIDVPDDQVEDRIDDALNLWSLYSYDGTEHLYYKYQLTVDDIANKYITLPDNIIGVVQVYPVGFEADPSNDIFNIKYQLMLNDLYTFTGVSLVPYYTTMLDLAFIEEILIGQIPITYTKASNRVYLQTDLSQIGAGTYLIFECYSVLDPTTYPKIWSDVWLREYTTCLIKLQWGENLSKFASMPVVGGLQINWQAIKQEAAAEKLRLEDKLRNTYSAPSAFYMG